MELRHPRNKSLPFETYPCQINSLTELHKLDIQFDAIFLRA